ncbi:MAG: threonyl-tRNA synthetase editing domain-containing protein [Bacteroidota bacterium]|nr:threonyl-tRNA synthetase editing domain-containing protein [Bacteroidota bacterium]
MKLLMVYCDKFAYKTTEKKITSSPDISEEKSYNDVLLSFIHIELQDQYEINNMETKLLKTLKAAAKRSKTNRIILYSFDHLSENKANPKLYKEVIEYIRKRLHDDDYECYSTPLGYLIDMEMKAPGTLFGRIFKSL